MPAIYDYKCNKCKETFEVMVSQDEKDSVKCPNCGKKLERQLSFTKVVIVK